MILTLPLKDTEIVINRILIYLVKEKYSIILFNAKSDEKYRWYWKSILHSILLFFLSFILLSTIIYMACYVNLRTQKSNSIYASPVLRPLLKLFTFLVMSIELDVFCGGHEQAHILLHLRSLTVDQPRMMQLCNVNKTFLCNYQKKYVSKKAAFFVRSFMLPICFYYVLVRKHMVLLWKSIFI